MAVVETVPACRVRRATAIRADAQVLKFDEIPGAATGFVTVGNFYNGGGGAAFDYGIEFVGNAEAFCLNRMGTPSCTNTSWGSDPGAIARGTEKAALDILPTSFIMNRAAGFTTGFSFYYANPYGDVGVFQVWSGLNATGMLLASQGMPATPDGRSNPACFFSNFCRFVANSVSFAGVAQSVRFTTTNSNYIVYDDITFGSTTPGSVVPEPSTMVLFASGLLPLGAAARRRQRSV